MTEDSDLWQKWDKDLHNQRLTFCLPERENPTWPAPKEQQKPAPEDCSLYLPPSSRLLHLLKK